MSINVTRDFIRNLTKNIRSAYGPDLKHTDAMDLVANALGWNTDALMHKLKSEGAKAAETAATPLEAPGDVPTDTLADWYVRRRWRERKDSHEFSISARERAEAGEPEIDVVAELALTRALFGEMEGAAGLVASRKPETPYSSLVWGVVSFMAHGDSPEARAFVVAGIGESADLFESVAVPRSMSRRLYGGDDRMSELRIRGDWWKLHEILERFPLDHVLDFIHEAAMEADICLVRDKASKKWKVQKNAGVGHFLEPAVPVAESVQEDVIFCLFDGVGYKMLKRHVRSGYNMTAEQYRRFWRLPDDYPMVCSGYQEEKRLVAKAAGLGDGRLLMELKKRKAASGDAKPERPEGTES